MNAEGTNELEKCAKNPTILSRDSTVTQNVYHLNNKVMDYEKLYKEALERAREIHNEHRAQCFDVMVKVFPEFKESEDERIRKDIIETIKIEAKEFPSSIIASKAELWLAWLEKQGKQKPEGMYN